MTTVLIDGDITVFQVASAVEQPTDFGDDLWVLWADAKVARAEFDNAVENIVKITGASEYIIFLTGSNNFRKNVADTYKANRASKRKPMLLPVLRNYAMGKHRAVMTDELEGDDLIGIAATGHLKGECIIYSADKDLKTIAGLHWDGEEVVTITDAQADRYFYSQILTGDSTDGYTGCPSIGPVTAAKILDKTDGTPKQMWDAVVETYEKKGLHKDDAIITARQAYILKSQDYVDGEVILWEPPND